MWRPHAPTAHSHAPATEYRTSTGGVIQPQRVTHHSRTRCTTCAHAHTRTYTHTHTHEHTDCAHPRPRHALRCCIYALRPCSVLPAPPPKLYGHRSTCHVASVVAACDGRPRRSGARERGVLGEQHDGAVYRTRGGASHEKRERRRARRYMGPRQPWSRRREMGLTRCAHDTTMSRAEGDSRGGRAAERVGVPIAESGSGAS